MTDDPEAARSQADAVFTEEIERGAKGSATLMIADEAKATREKTARLKALRLAREDAETPAPAPVRRRAPARKKAASA